MKKILSIFCLLCLFALPLVLTACESPEEEAVEETEGDATVETTFEEGAVEVDETVDPYATDTEMDTDMDMGTEMDEPPVE
jgi:hypothetical protein